MTTNPARALATAIEPFSAQVYFSPECHASYEALGFGPSPGKAGEVSLPDGPAYFCSRGSILGQVPGEVVAAAFGVFNPDVVVPAVRHGWTLTDATTIEAARTEGALAQLRRILGDEPEGLRRAVELLQRAVGGLRPEGRPLYAGLLALGVPDDPLGLAWRLADRLREYRGDSHIAAWTSAGFDATEIGLITELYWGLPLRTYIRTRAWTSEQLDVAEERLVSRGLVKDAALTPEGRSEREAVEAATDRACRRIVDNLVADVDELVSIVGGWSKAIQAADGYPASGPHELAQLSRRS
ncbi:MAG TPA: hypothetical protein VNF71_02155 [Acidimicrobiales bacterium]|nr:hypothetical protein [Acidimicrobiales bacterium]